MDVYGIDFTSAPRRAKPITVARCSFDKNLLTLHNVQKLVAFGAFEDFLHTSGPWIAGMDFPFGQPRRLVVNLGWPLLWEQYLARVGSYSKSEFEQVLTDYKQPRAKGDKHHLRETDICAGSCSPMMLYGVPVAKMFFQGALRLVASPASIEPVRRTQDNRTIVEAYPALVVRKFVSSPYKHDKRAKQVPSHRMAREKVVNGLRSELLAARYGIRVLFGQEDAQSFCDDPTGDCLDALLCAIQAAWSFTRRLDNFGIPLTCDPVEGWIVDPDQDATFRSLPAGQAV